MPRLIVNADDFGLAGGINAGIVEAHVDGVLTSTSLMVDGPGAAEAARLAGEHPGLSVGLHFVDDGPELDRSGHAAREFTRQLERFRELIGRDPTHVDSHHHVHVTRLSTFTPLVEPLGVPLRGDGRVRYLGAFFAQTRRGVVELDRIGEPFLLGLLKARTGIELTELGCHPGRVTPDLRSSYRDERELELSTLTAPGLRKRIEALGWRLASFYEWRTRA